MNDTPLVTALQNTSLHGLLMLIAKALARAGYGDVQILDRRTPKQKSRFGGHEIQCLTNIGNLPGKVVVKVIRDTVRLRMLDEIAGATMRVGGDIAMVITPFHMTRRAKANLAKYRAARVEVIDGSAMVGIHFACEVS